MNDDLLLTVLFWLAALVGFAAIYLVPVATVAIGCLLLKGRPNKRAPGLVVLAIGALLCAGVILWRVLDFLSYSLG
jgi:ABC-type transport system involved in multi-copper enzyme maturation permease subunit